MKCPSCNNEIPENVTNCPSCGVLVKEDTSILPVVPEHPVLPQDQNMEMEEKEGKNGNMKEENSQVLEPAQEIGAGVQAEAPTQPVAETPIVEPAPPVAETPVEPAPVASSPVAEPVAPANVNPQVLPNGNVAPSNGVDFVQNSINESMNGVKIANSAPEAGEKAKKKNVLAVIAGIVILALIAGGVFFYMYEFKSANKRVEKIVEQMLSFTNNLANEKIEKASGSIAVNGKVSADSQTVETDFTMKYAYDTKAGLYDFNFDVNKLNLGQDLIPEPLKAQMYINNDTIFFMVSNFYDKYIAVESEGLGDQIKSAFEASKSDVNYKLIVDGFKSAILSAVKSCNYEQTIGDADINGTKKKVNIVKLNFTSQNQKTFYRSFVNSVVYNEELLKELAKVSDSKATDIKKSFEEIIEDENLNKIKDVNASMEFYSPIFGNSLLGMRLVSNEKDAEFNLAYFTTEKGVKLTLKQKDQDIFKIDVSYEELREATKTELTGTINGEIYMGSSAVKMDLTIKTISDVSPKVEKVTTKNSIKVESLTPADLQQILNKIKSFGNLGVMLSPYLPEVQTTSPYCSAAVSCVPNATGTQTCTYCMDDTCLNKGQVECPMN